MEKKRNIDRYDVMTFTDATQPKVSIIIPAYNEEKRIRSTLLSYAEFFDDPSHYEIIVEMDGCVDKTAEIVSEIQQDYPHIHTLEFKERLGKGAGIVRGVRVAKGDIIGFSDADGSVDPEEFSKLINAVINGSDCAIASRRTANSIVEEQHFSRRFLGVSFNMLVRMLFLLPYKDTQCGAKVFRGNAIRDVAGEVRVNGFAFDINVLYLLKSSGYSIKEVGIKWKAALDSKVNLTRTPVKMFVSVLWLRLFYSPLRPMLKEDSLPPGFQPVPQTNER